MTWKTALFSILALTGSTSAIAQDDIFAETEPVALHPSDPDVSEVGELAYRGGVEIEPGEEDLGGISGLEWRGDRLYAVMDSGRWLTITPAEIQSQLVDLDAVSAGPLLGLNGKELKRKKDADAEAITRVEGGDGWLVAFERDHRVWRYDNIAETARPSSLQISQTTLSLGENSGIETLASYTGGMLICAEQAGAAAPNCIRIDAGNAAPLQLTAPPELAEHGGVPTDAACTADGTCYVLFRSYQPDAGNRAAILELSPDNETRTLAVMQPPLTIDNFEGLAVRQHNGKTYLYVASDNNFSRNQRTLLMKFEVKSAPPVPIVSAAPEAPEDAKKFETVDVVLTTAMGDITIALETERAPITAGNFLRYVDEGRFNGTVFYRAFSADWGDQPNGLLQGGTQGDRKRVLDPIAHEPTSKTGLLHTKGAVSMARLDPGTATGDFTIMMGELSSLDAKPDDPDPANRPGFAAFGRVIDGWDVVIAIHAAPTDPEEGEGSMKGQMLADPVKIISASRKVSEPPE